ncbi:MAG: hypothetical protein R3F05_20175, partial [Planctomycetota bacterium]
MRQLRAMSLALALFTALAAPRAAHASPPPGASEVLAALEAAGVADAPGALKALAMRLGSALRNAGTQVGRWGITQTEQVGMHLLEHPGVRRSILAFVRDNAATLRVQGTAMIERHLFTPLLESSLGRRLFATAAEVAYRAVARGGVDLTTAASQVVQTSPWGRFAGWASTTFPRVGRAFGWVAEVATSVTAASIMNFATVAQVADAVIDEALESYQTTLETMESADDLDAFNRNVDLLLERLVDGRARLAEGQTLGRALRRLRANLDLGRQPFDGIVSRAAVPAETTSGDPMAAGEVWVLDGPAVIDAAPGSTPWKSGASQLHVGDNQLSAGGAV